MNYWIIISIYWVVAVAAVYAIRAYNNKKNRFKKAALKSMGMTEVTSVWKQIGTHASILFLVPPLMPIRWLSTAAIGIIGKAWSDTVLNTSWKKAESSPKMTAWRSCISFIAECGFE